MKAHAGKSSATREPVRPTIQNARPSATIMAAEPAVRADGATTEVRAGAVAQRAWVGSPQRARMAALQAVLDKSPRTTAQVQLQALMKESPRMKAQMRRQAMIDVSSSMGARRQGLNRSLTAAVQRQAPQDDAQHLQAAPPMAVQLKPGAVVQRVLIDGIEVNKKTKMPTWDQGGFRYHINLTTATSHVSREGSPMIHYFFEGTGTSIEDKQPTKEERGGKSKKKVKGVKGKVKTKTVFSALPSAVQDFVKDNWDEILK